MSSKMLIVLFCVLATVLANDEKVTYTDKYDNVDLHEILGNKKILHAYVDCVLESGQCTPDAKELKSVLKEAIETGCEKCTKTHEERAFTVIKHLIEFELDIWHKVTAKFDPEGKWRKVYEERARENGIVVPEWNSR